jgi:hypothetical protein
MHSRRIVPAEKGLPVLPGALRIATNLNKTVFYSVEITLKKLFWTGSQ